MEPASKKAKTSPSPPPPAPAPPPDTYPEAIHEILQKIKAPADELSGPSPILTASIIAGQAVETFQRWLDDASATDGIAEVSDTAAQAQRRAAALLTTHKAELEAFEADGSKLFAWVEQNAPAAARKWAKNGYSNERKWLLKAVSLLNDVVNPPGGGINGDLPPFFYCLGKTEDRVEAVCTMLVTWVLALDAATQTTAGPRFGAVYSRIHTWLRELHDLEADEVEIQQASGGSVWLPQPLFADEDFEEGLDMHDSTNCTTMCTYHYLRGYVQEYRDQDPKAAYLQALQACSRNPLARNSLEQVSPAAARAIAKAPYGPDTERPKGMNTEHFITFLIENAVKKMRERYRLRAERAFGKANVAPYARTAEGKSQLDVIESWLKVLGQRAGAGVLAG
jgi:hypothetical protein